MFNNNGVNLVEIIMKGIKNRDSEEGEVLQYWH